MDKQFLVAQLVDRLSNTARAALASSEGMAAEARDGATPDEKREDARAAQQVAVLGRAQDKRARQALGEIDALATFRPGALRQDAKVAVGAIVEIEDEESGEGRTFF